MDDLVLSGYLLTAGFLVIILATFVGPPRLYQESGHQERLAIIARHRLRWQASNVLFAAGGLATAAGLISFSLAATVRVNALANGLAAVAFSIGTLAWVIFIFRRTVDPAQLFQNYTFSPLTVVLVAALSLGLLLYGVVYRQVGLPAWLAAGTIGSMMTIDALALLFPKRFFARFPPQIFYLVTLVAGIVLLLQ